jgi:hypothetical protein
MREFSRLKFASRDTLRATSKDINDPTRDTKWLTRLIEVRNFFQTDPISLAVIYRSFPNLANLFITALAATADYNHTEDDDLNNQTLILKRCLKVLVKTKTVVQHFKHPGLCKTL